MLHNRKKTKTKDTHYAFPNGAKETSLKAKGLVVVIFYMHRYLLSLKYDRNKALCFRGGYECHSCSMTTPHLRQNILI